MGSVRVASTGQLTALACPNGFFGISSDLQYGARLRPCRPCPASQVSFS